jgi:hypothetical protein
MIPSKARGRPTEMDVLVALSASPSEDVLNDYAPKALGVEIREA